MPIPCHLMPLRPNSQAKRDSSQSLIPLTPVTTIRSARPIHARSAPSKHLVMRPIKHQCQALAPAPVPHLHHQNSLWPLQPLTLIYSPQFIMCYFGIVGLRYGCRHVWSIQLEWMVSPCDDEDCCTHPLHPQPCNNCLNTCYTNLNIDHC
jgi:hypothetical protein